MREKQWLTEINFCHICDFGKFLCLKPYCSLYLQLETLAVGFQVFQNRETEPSKLVNICIFTIHNHSTVNNYYDNKNSSYSTLHCIIQVHIYF